MKKNHFTDRKELYDFLDAQEHDYMTEGMQLFHVQYTGAALVEGGWNVADEPDGLLDMLAEPSDDGEYLTAYQARVILDDIAKYSESTEEE